MNEAAVAVESHNLLGEGPLWDPRSHILFWVDIERSELHSFQTGKQKHEITTLPIAFTALGLRRKGGLVVAHRNGFGFYDPETQVFESIAEVIQENPDSRFNDGAVDPAGNFYAGTYSKSHQPTSRLYRLDQDLTVHEIEAGLINSNGIGWSPDNQLMYHTDTRRWKIYAYDYDLESGGVSHRRPFIEVPDIKEEGVPDGLTVDQEGYLWSARYYGGKIVRYTPTGEIDREIPLPVENVTSCCFGGKDLSTLYITTSSSGLSESDRAKSLAGNLFALDTHTRGLPKNYFEG